MDSRILLAGAFVSLISIFDFPIGFYTFVRIAVTLCAVYGAYYFFKDKKGIWIILALTAIFYNPFIPIYLYEKALWVFINLITFLIFIYSYHLSSGRHSYEKRIVFIHGGKFILLFPIFLTLYVLSMERDIVDTLVDDFDEILIFLIVFQIPAIAVTLIWNKIFNKKITLWMSDK